MKSLARSLGVAAFGLALVAGSLQAATGRPKDTPSPSPSPSGSASPAAALPTATPEPAEVAIPRLEAKLKADPNDKDAMAELAGYYLSVGRVDQGLALTQRLISLGTKTAQVYYLDGLANQSLGRIPQATADFENASNQEPTNAQILLTLTRLYLQTGRAADAERVAKRATTFNQSDKGSYENYGLVLAQEKKYDEARQQFETAAKLDPKDPQPVILEAKSYIEQNAFALSQQLFDRALTIDPKSTDALLGKARLLALEHNVKDSIATYEQLLPILPNDDAKASLMIEEYQVYREEKLDSDADAAIKRAVTTYPNVSAVHVAYGDYYASKKDTTNAESEWKTALGPNRDNPDALQRLGELAISQQKFSAAQDYFKRLTEVLPNDPSAFMELGQVYGASRQYDKSHDAYRRSFELSRTPQSLAGLGTTDFELKNYKECSQIFDAIDKNVAAFLKQNPQLLYVMGKCYQSTSQRDKARGAYVRFQGYVKPGTQLAVEVKKLIDGLGSSPSAKPTPKATAKPSPKPTGH